MDPKVASQPLHYQTWFLKVSIHCEGCTRKVKKVLRGIDGVFTATIDPQIQKVTVTGNVGVETLLRKLVKAGKHAEIWPENLAGEEKKNKKNKNGAREKQSLENRGTKSDVNCDTETKSNSNTKPEKSPAGNQVPPEGGDGGKNKKKGKSQSGGNGNNGASAASASASAHTGFQLQNIGLGPQMGQVNMNPTRQQSFSYSETGYHPMVYFTAYNNRLYPNPMARIGGPSYYVSSSPYTCAGVEQDGYQFQSAPLVSFEIFSDDNANGCSIM